MTIWDRGTYEVLKWEDEKVEVALHGERVEGPLRAVPDRAGPKDWMIHRMEPPADPDAEPMPERLVPMLARPGTLPPDDDALGLRDQVGRRARDVLQRAGADAPASRATATTSPRAIPSSRG